MYMVFPGSANGKGCARQCRRCKRLGFNSWVGKISWSRKWQPTPVFLPGEFKRLNLKPFINSPLSFIDPVGKTEKKKKLFKSTLHKL